VKIIDSSTAHSTNQNWAYGFPELSKNHRDKIKSSNRVAVPGCHASGAIALIYPLIAGGLISKDYPFVIHSVTGYSGGGKKMIAEYENTERSIELDSPRQYGLNLNHKHIPEIKNICNLSDNPIFNPIVADYYSGMCVTVPVFAKLMTKNFSLTDIKNYFLEYYKNQKLVNVAEMNFKPDFLAANLLTGKNNMEIYIGGNEQQFLLTARFDNLGKGASGAAVQCMNIMLGIEETISLI
jgi:N-acetyl-gamma-glutamyl-phosphate reductase